MCWSGRESRDTARDGDSHMWPKVLAPNLECYTEYPVYFIKEAVNSGKIIISPVSSAEFYSVWRLRWLKEESGSTSR